MNPLERAKLIFEGKLDSRFENISKGDLLLAIGKPDEIEVYNSKEKFFHYDNIRYSFKDDIVNLITINFASYPEYRFVISNDPSPIVISKDITLSKLISQLNDERIRWKVESRESQFDYLVLGIHDYTKIYFYLPLEFLDRMEILVSQ